MFTFLSYILEHALTWLKYLLYFLIFDELFRVIVSSGNLNSIKIMALYMQNLSTFRLFPEAAVLYMTNTFLGFISLEVLVMVLGHRHLPNAKDGRS